MTDQGSTYSVLQNVPVMIIIASELKPIPDDISQLTTYPFSTERQVLSYIEASRKNALEEEEALRAKRAQYEQEKINQQKLAARRIAPGFLDTDTRILKPEQKYNHTPEATVEEPQELNQTSSESNHEKFDYLRFEQGLAPADPWDAPENDFVALRSVLGSSPKANYSTPTSRTSPVTYTSYQQQQQQQQPRPYPPKNEGAYWNFQNGTAMPYPQGLSPQSVPAIPPKLFTNSPLPSSSTSSPIISHPSSLKPPAHSAVSPTPPPIPPLPNPPYEHLIEELNNMGFTRAQAIDALEKNNHDLIKATNFLLDQA
ncbi:hypothetical protein RMCBS344292_07892 [Rhizopus microsporus]|nr:hypothetical protein RMCBS344292_07892 [Rhizopus microsporus]